jgi:hypothetical protein
MLWLSCFSTAPLAALTSALMVCTAWHVKQLCVSCVVTRGATEGLKMVGEYFPWTDSSHFIYTQANHKSVLGIGSYAKASGAQLRCLKREEMEGWLQNQDTTHPVTHATATTSEEAGTRSTAATAAMGCCSSVSGGPCSEACVGGGDQGGHCSSAYASDSPPLSESCSPVTNSSGFSSSIGSEGLWGQVVLECGGSEGGSSRPTSGSEALLVHHLVAYPAKDNYEGQLYPLEWIEQVGLGGGGGGLVA